MFNVDVEVLNEEQPARHPFGSLAAVHSFIAASFARPEVLQVVVWQRRAARYFLQDKIETHVNPLYYPTTN